jgi:drug/metabolite transporter (DMT)-like permease
MSLAVFLAVLFAAALHAGWNALVKLGLDRFSSILFLALVQGGIALVLLPWFGLPPGAAWPWVLAGSALHSGYKLVLIRAYGHGDLSQVYPLARGTAPLIVAVAGALFLGEAMDLARGGAVAAIAAGIMLMAGTGGLTRAGLGWALATAAFTASYTLADGVGARIAGSASAFTLTMFVLDGLIMLAFGLAARGRAAILALLPAWRGGLAAGAMSLSAYWIAIWAFTQAPLAMVAALRETSVLFAMLIAALLLKERLTPRRWAAGGLILAGVALMRV